MSIISRVWLGSHWYDGGMYIMHRSGKLFYDVSWGLHKIVRTKNENEKSLC